MPVHLYMEVKGGHGGVQLYHFLLLRSFETGLLRNLELGRQTARPKNPERKVQIPRKKRLL